MPFAPLFPHSSHYLAPDFETFRNACAQLGLELSEGYYRRLLQYADRLTDWNSRINLISRKDTGRILTYHVIDSLAAAQLIPPRARCCDIGTGAGLPGVPLAIVRPDVQIILVESLQKRCRFLTSVVEELGLNNVAVVWGRAESFEALACDIVLSRLTGPLRKTLKFLVRHAQPGGAIILYKNPAGAEPDGPLLGKLGLTVVRTLDLKLPFTFIPRRFVVLRRCPVREGSRVQGFAG